MQFYITNFGNMRYLTDDCIPISTCMYDPPFFHNNTRNKNICFVDHKNIMNGIREEALSQMQLKEEDCVCQKDCIFKCTVPNCPFLNAYIHYLDTINFEYLLSEFQRTAEEVRMVTHFIGEPKIVLLVYEAVTNPCSERIALIDYFKKHGIELKEYKKSIV